MSIALARIFVRSPTRLRCFFTDTVTAAPSGAFAVSSLDGNANPSVVEALILQGSQVELVLATGLVGGGSYQLGLTGGLVAGGGPTAPAATMQFSAPAVRAAPSAELSIQLLSSNLFGEDIAWNGSDWVQGPDGDLAIISGQENARSAIVRRMFSEGLLWAPDYGLKPTEFVDGPAGELPQLVGRAQAQALADDRVTKATATLLGESPEDPAEQVIQINLTLADATQTTVQATVPTL